MYSKIGTITVTQTKHFKSLYQNHFQGLILSSYFSYKYTIKNNDSQLASERKSTKDNK